MHDTVVAGEVLGQSEAIILVVSTPVAGGVHPMPVRKPNEKRAVLWLGGNAIFPSGIWRKGTRRFAEVRRAKRGARWTAWHGLSRNGVSHSSREGVSQACIVAVRIVAKSKLVPLFHDGRVEKTMSRQ